MPPAPRPARGGRYVRLPSRPLPRRRLHQLHAPRRCPRSADHVCRRPARADRPLRSGDAGPAAGRQRLPAAGTLDRLGVEGRYAHARDVSIARRASVALMDRHIGPTC
ncbi:hypothetical protein SLNWT_5887 [Streptomyces albus]|uniref:Uncharacterized protein n=1 Tax=Streptomyces albus (strain ATCC 21838 / DSM 41398 / FERM P-419 / JCM 4703 / NBRC 107858) TaxID=1081613 RepID=A0A0B5ETV2_STRA4|nr:hypothetical protein SLNWT_5887 [Streptomyces albus]AOU80565.1 hypothetical protein SLNHY_5874 [Streptomyces albus]